MNSEKVKEIKEALECCKQNEIEETCGYCLVCPASNWDYEKECMIDLFQKTLTLINELESENEILKFNMHETENLSFQINQMNGNLILENQALKDRLAELESKIGSRTLIEFNKLEFNKPFVVFDYTSNGKEYYAIRILEERDLAINLTKEKAEARLKELQEKEECR